MLESKNEAFQRISKNRLEKIEKAVSTLGNLSSNNYESSSEERIQLVKMLLSYTQNLCDAFQVDFPKQTNDETHEDTELEVCIHCGGKCRQHLNNICEDLLHENSQEILKGNETSISNNKSKSKMNTQQSVLKVVRDLEFGEIPLFTSALQEALTNFSNNKPGSEIHLRQILKISAISLLKNDTE